MTPVSRASKSASSPRPAKLSFPRGFLWGIGTAATQVEGAADLDGKGPSIWDVFARRPGAVERGDTPAIACNHYHFYEEDFDLLRSLGLEHYRFSVNWSRVLPQGRGAINERGLDYYDRVTDALLARGITPSCTLYHWDLPQALEDEGGWRVRSTPEAFARYAEIVVKRLGDRVKTWWTLNEINTFVAAGYGFGSMAPGAKEPPAVVNQCYHHALLAHGHAVRAVRAHGGRGAQVGLIHNPDATVPVCEHEADIAAARAQFFDNNSRIFGPVFLGEYPARLLRKLGADRAKVARGDLELISTPTDLLGLNLYRAYHMRAGKRGHPEFIPWDENDYPHAGESWLTLVPEALYWGPRFAREVFGVRRMHIAEYGAAFHDAPREDGRFLDSGRRVMLRSYLREAHRAAVEGWGLEGFFLWTFLDNYEWNCGYRPRFGIVHVDFATQKRTPKLSAGWYAEVARRNALM